MVVDVKSSAELTDSAEVFKTVEGMAGAVRTSHQDSKVAPEGASDSC